MILPGYEESSESEADQVKTSMKCSNICIKVEKNMAAGSSLYITCKLTNPAVAQVHVSRARKQAMRHKNNKT